MVHCNRLYR